MQLFQKTIFWSILIVVIGFLGSTRPVQALTPSCANGTVDVKSYIAPECGSDVCPQIYGSSITASERYIGNVINHVEWVDGRSMFKQHSNGIHFLYNIKAGFVGLMQDTIWDPFRCTNGVDAMYRVYSGGNPNDTSEIGSDNFPFSMSCGENHPYQSFIVAYEYNPAIEEPGNHLMSLNECSVPGQSRTAVGNSVQLIFQGQALCNPDQNGNKTFDIIALQNTGGAGAGEVFFYCQGYGLCAWYHHLSSSEDPATWDATTDVCNLESFVDKYVYPISGLKENSAAKIASNLAGDLGYTVMCAPTIEVTAEQSGRIEKLPASGTWIDFAAGLTMKPDPDSFFPIMRSEGDSVLSSLENYFGYIPAQFEEDQDASVYSAPLYSLLPLSTQCTYQIKILETIEKYCNRLADPASCPLYTQVPGTSYTTNGLLSAFRQSGLKCEQVSNPTPPSGSSLSQTAYDDLKTALRNTPLFMRNAYRLGFLVVVVDNENPDKLPGTFFSFLAKLPPLGGEDVARAAAAKDSVKVMPFLVPDFGTQKPMLNEQDFYYSDPLDITKEALQPLDVTRQQAAEEAGRRSSYAAQAVSYLQNPPLEPPVNCEPECGEGLNQALVAMINTSGLSCDGVSPESLKAEDTESIGSELKAEPSETLDFDNPDEDDPVRVANTVQQAPSSLNFEFMAAINAGLRQPPKSETTIRQFVIMPYGPSLDQATKTLAGTVLTLDMMQHHFEDPTLARYFKLENFTQLLESDKPQIKIPLPANDPCVLAKAAASAEDPYKGCNEVEVFAKADTTQSAPRVPGGLLGNVVRLVQRSLWPLDSEPNEYIASCKTTEEYLLGKCSGNAQRSSSDTSDTKNGTPGPGPSCPFTGKTTTIPPLADLKNMICDASEEFQVPGFMLASVLFIEGGEARTITLGGNRVGEQIACSISDTGDVGPMQINISACRSNGSNQPYSGTFNVCQFEDAVRFAASILKSKAAATVAAGDADRAASKSDWSYDLAYFAGGRYNGAPSCIKGASQATALAGGTVNGQPASYCKFMAEAFDNDLEWRCDGDPGPWTTTFDESHLAR